MHALAANHDVYRKLKLTVRSAGSSDNLTTGTPTMAVREPNREDLESENPFAISPVPFDAPTPASYGIDFGTKLFPHPFDFEVPKGYKIWPIPIFDDFSQKAHKTWPSLKLHSRCESANKRRTTSPSGAKRAGRVRATPRTNKKLAKATKVANAFSTEHYHNPPPRDDGPLQLLTLPGEIRNQIYREIVVSGDPLFAHFRPVFVPKSHGNGMQKRINKYPLEPALSCVNKQLRQEVLSLFYGDNKFIFRDYHSEPLSYIQMTRPEWIQRWSPAQPGLESIRHVELKLIGVKRWQSVSLKIVKNAKGDVQFTLDCTPQHACICLEKFCRDTLQVQVRRDGPMGDLVNVASIFAARRINGLPDVRVTVCTCDSRDGNTT